MPFPNNTLHRRFTDSLSETLSEYISNLNGQQCHHLHRLVMSTVEEELISFALNHYDGNRSKAAKMLGISRTTLLRKKGIETAI
ncbi:Fis family transcriptional regulator [Candidatus Persebacteraceae bacterium Df01]|jgi:Fis family transcriptional regulator|uniref:Fis family transcriptional regulator n=1 Tax=Candidatus Doriopsillibacter californiensis TaxID=2970740 RepID=A0ABT7QMP1_9GAMM|nr:Fis family transcriptional regulator [Candidatus Persebacteraceae bacterium Df01]